MRSSASSTSASETSATGFVTRDVGEVGELEVRQHLEGDREGEVALGVHRLLDLVLVLGELDLRLEGELQAVVLDDLAVGLVDGVLHARRP